MTYRRTLISLVLGGGIFLSFLAQAEAGCRYFRVSTKLLECKEETAAEMKGMERPELELPELTPTDEGKLMHVRCSCEYTFYGANPLCDSSQTQEFTSAMGTDNTTNPCADAKAFCEHVCPQDLD